MNLNQITIPVKNMEECKEFYRALGFQQIVDTDDYARFLSIEGDNTFSLHKTENVYYDSNYIIYFECTNLEKTVKDLEEKGIPFETKPKKQEWLWVESYLRDPSGNQVCLYFAGKNRKHPPWAL